MKIIAMLIVCLLFLGAQLVNAQNKTLTGTVISSEDNQPLPGVNVIVKGTTQGTITDFDGKFTLSVAADAEALVFSFMGMQTQEVPVGSTTTFNITMDPESIGMDEVVVTALGIKKEAKALGYAVQEVKSENLTRAASPDLSRALQGKVAGVDIKVSSGMPGASAQFVIRGSRSFTGDNAPLYVVDGMPIESGARSTGQSVTGSDFSNRSLDINPNDIESINVLKGQAAAALYGLRASNGVVVITTKSGKGGEKGKTIVTVSENVSFDIVSRNPDFQKTYAQGSDGKYIPNSSMSWGPKIEDLPDDPDYGGNTDNEYTQKYGMQQGKYFVPQLEAAGLDPWLEPKTYNNWKDYYRTGITTTTGVNVSQATEDGNYSLSLGHTDQSGIALNTGMKRWTGNASAERKLGKYFTTGFNANYSNVTVDKLAGANDASLQGVAMAPVSYNLKGTPYCEPGDPYSQIYYRGLTFDNPYWVEKNNTYNEETNRFFGNANVGFNINLTETMKLNAKYQLGMDMYTTHYQDICGYGSRGQEGSIDNYGETDATVNSLFTLGYDWRLTDEMSVNLMVGNEFNHERYKFYEQYGEKFNFGGWNHIQNLSGSTTASEEQSEYRTVGFFYSASWDFKSMIYLNTTGRNDIVSKMPRGNRSFFYPSVSLGFVATALEPLQDIDWLSFAKARFSFAEVGMAERYYKPYYDNPTYGGGFWSGTPVSYPINSTKSYVQYPNTYDPNLKPQNTKSFEVGLDMKFFNNRLGFDYTFSRQNIKDQIFDVPLAGSTGFSSLTMNAGKAHTNAHEVVVYTTPVRNDDWEWNVNFNYTKMDNVVDELAEGVESIFLGGFVDPQVRLGVGYEMPVIYGVSFMRDDDGHILVDEDPSSSKYGMPMQAPEKVLAKVSPDFIAGATTDVTYKGLTLSAVLEWKQGGHMYHGSNNCLDMYGVSAKTEDRTSTFVYDGYKSNGEKNDIVRGGINDPGAYQTLYADVLSNISEAAVYGNSFVKLREVALKYSVPEKVIPKVYVTLSAFARNILLWSELDNFDPESSQGTGNMTGGFERFSLPQTKSFGFGVEVKF